MLKVVKCINFVQQLHSQCLWVRALRLTVPYVTARPALNISVPTRGYWVEKFCIAFRVAMIHECIELDPMMLMRARSSTPIARSLLYPKRCRARLYIDDVVQTLSILR